MFKSLFIAVIAFSSMASANPLLGRWLYSHDQCINGNRPSDRWGKVKLISMAMELKPNQEISFDLNFKPKIPELTCAMTLTGSYTVADGKLSITLNKIVDEGAEKNCNVKADTELGKSEVTGYVLSDSDLIVNRDVNGKYVCGQEGDLVEVYQKIN